MTDLRIADGTTLTGGGSVILSNTGNSRIWGTDNTGTETLINVDNTISGAGQIGVSNSIGIINQAQGVIDANVSGATLNVDPSATNGGLTNQGTMRATNGGILQFTGPVTSSGTVDVGSSSLVINGSGSYTQTGGTFRVAGGSVSSVNILDIQGGLVDAYGSISASINNNAMLQPAFGVGGLNVTGNVTLLNSSKLSFQLGGLIQGTQYGFMNVNGTVGLGGQLVLSFVNGFQNSVNSSEVFTLMLSTTALQGSFSNVAAGGRLAVSNGPGSFLVNYNGNTLTLSNYSASMMTMIRRALAAQAAVNTAAPNGTTGVSEPTDHESRNSGSLALTPSRSIPRATKLPRPTTANNVPNATTQSSSSTGVPATSRARSTARGNVVRISGSSQLQALIDKAAPAAGGKMVVPAAANGANPHGQPRSGMPRNGADIGHPTAGLNKALSNTLSSPRQP